MGQRDPPPPLSLYLSPQEYLSFAPAVHVGDNKDCKRNSNIMQ